jgi:hypothetical protein
MKTMTTMTQEEMLTQLGLGYVTGWTMTKSIASKVGTICSQYSQLMHYQHKLPNKLGAVYQLAKMSQAGQLEAIASMLTKSTSVETLIAISKSLGVSVSKPKSKLAATLLTQPTPPAATTVAKPAVGVVDVPVKSDPITAVATPTVGPKVIGVVKTPAGLVIELY